MDDKKINGLIRTAISAAGGGAIAAFVAWARARGIDVPGAEEIAGIIAGAIMAAAAPAPQNGMANVSAGTFVGDFKGNEFGIEGVTP